MIFFFFFNYGKFQIYAMVEKLISWSFIRCSVQVLFHSYHPPALCLGHVTYPDATPGHCLE